MWRWPASWQVSRLDCQCCLAALLMVARQAAGWLALEGSAQQAIGSRFLLLRTAAASLPGLAAGCKLSLASAGHALCFFSPCRFRGPRPAQDRPRPRSRHAGELTLPLVCSVLQAAALSCRTAGLLWLCRLQGGMLL